MTSRAVFDPARQGPPATCRATTFLGEGKKHERAGRLTEAAFCFNAAIEAAGHSGNRTVLAESLRRLAVVRHLRNESGEARTLCQRSHDVATESGDRLLAAEALNTLAGFGLEGGEYGPARELFDRALALAGEEPGLRARIEQNLGILANIRGDHADALAHYQRSLDAFQLAGDERGRALAYHNLGMISADRRLWEDADRYYRQSFQIADRIGDEHLRALCLLNHTEVHLARQRYEEGRQSAEAALHVFDQLGVRDGKAAAYRFLGVLYRETGSPALAEARLLAAVDMARDAGDPLGQAEASRELALLYQALGRNQEALRLLNMAHRLFRRLDARADLVDVARKTGELEGTFLKIVREWGQSIESADSYTFGHCERVATYAVAVARALRLDETEVTTIRLGAYLHDVGKVRVPHEILNKPGALTPDEFEVIKMHPVWGLELLAAIEFPWDIKPIIRWHHERYDGTGYPDRLRGDEIPLSAQIICIVDVYDALTTTRSYRPAMRPPEALRVMGESRHWWRPDVFEAFLASVAREVSAA